MASMDKSGDMERLNWLTVFAGLLLFFSGFFILSFVGRDYHGFLGFLAPFVLISGLVLIGLGLLIKKSDKKSE